MRMFSTDQIIIICTTVITGILLYLVQIITSIVRAWACIETTKSLENRIKNLHYNTEEQIDLSVFHMAMNASNKDEKERAFNTLAATARMHWKELGEQRELIVSKESIFIQT